MVIILKRCVTNDSKCGELMQSKRQKAMMTKIKNKYGTFTWNPKTYRINQVVKGTDITGRHGDMIGTFRIAYSEATTPEQFKKEVTNIEILNGKPLGVTMKGQILNKRFKVTST